MIAIASSQDAGLQDTRTDICNLIWCTKQFILRQLWRQVHNETCFGYQGDTGNGTNDVKEHMGMAQMMSKNT